VLSKLPHQIASPVKWQLLVQLLGLQISTAVAREQVEEMPSSLRTIHLNIGFFTRSLPKCFSDNPSISLQLAPEVLRHSHLHRLSAAFVVSGSVEAGY
jgi:hypothetical protein